MQVRLLYFAILRDITGTNESTFTFETGATPADVWQALRQSHPQLQDYPHPPMIAINETYATPDVPLRDGDVLAFIPPVAGG